MARDVPKENATVLLEGEDTEGNPAQRWLDETPGFDDVANMTWVNISHLRPIIIRRWRRLKPFALTGGKDGE